MPDETRKTERKIQWKIPQTEKDTHFPRNPIWAKTTHAALIYRLLVQDSVIAAKLVTIQCHHYWRWNANPANVQQMAFRTSDSKQVMESGKVHWNCNRKLIKAMGGGISVNGRCASAISLVKHKTAQQHHDKLPRKRGVQIRIHRCLLFQRPKDNL